MASHHHIPFHHGHRGHQETGNHPHGHPIGHPQKSHRQTFSHNQVGPHGRAVLGDVHGEAIFGDHHNMSNNHLEANSNNGNGPYFNNLDLPHHGRLIIQASSSGQPSRIRHLLECGANPDQRSPHGTPVVLAARFRHHKAVEMLIDQGADVTTHDQQGYSALHWAVHNGDVKTAELLIDNGSSVRWPHPTRRSLLHMACMGNVGGERGKEMVKLLIDNGADCLAVTKEGNTALALAAARNQWLIVSLLLSRFSAPAQLRVCNNKGQTALIYAISMGNDSNRTAVEELLRHGADLTGALRCAEKRGQRQILRLLQQHFDQGQMARLPAPSSSENTGYGTWARRYDVSDHLPTSERGYRSHYYDDYSDGQFNYRLGKKKSFWSKVVELLKND